jgi:hypothetical protein
VQAGDVFGSHEYHAPPDDPRWVLLSSTPGHRVWLRVAELRPIAGRALQEAAGSSRVLYAVQPADIGAEGFVVWQATMKAGNGPLTAVFDAREGLALDPPLVSTVCEPPSRLRAAMQCSGIVALTAGAAASYRAGELAVGFQTEGDPSGVMLAIARPLASPDERR